jgi:hypothetical protein
MPNHGIDFTLEYVLSGMVKCFCFLASAETLTITSYKDVFSNLYSSTFDSITGDLPQSFIGLSSLNSFYERMCYITFILWTFYLFPFCYIFICIIFT